MIKTVAFDADETLVDTPAAVTAALTAIVAELRVPGLTVDLFRDDAALFWKQIPEQPAHEIRAAATKHTLDRFGMADELDRVIEIFFEVRFANSRPYPDVLAALSQLRPAYQLGYATNANSEAKLCGLAGQFAFEIYALRTGVPKKPHVGFYEAVALAAEASPEQIIYVGDSYEHDIVGPADFGMRTVWLNKAGAPIPGPTKPDAVISAMSELPEAISRLGY